MYLRYSDLKKDIKKRIADNGGLIWTDKDEDEFVNELLKELDKVYDFQKTKVSRHRRRGPRRHVACVDGICGRSCSHLSVHPVYR